MNKPTTKEYNPYFQQYLDLVNNGDFFTSFEANTKEIVKEFELIPLEKHDFRYEKDKWTIKQMLLHIIDTERIFSYRILVILRNDAATTLQSFDDNQYADNAKADNRTMTSLIEEFKVVRKSTFILLENIESSESKLFKNVSGTNTSIRAIAYVILGHAKHHLNVLKERY